MRSRILLVPFLVLGSIAFCAGDSAHGQGFLKNLGNQLGNQLGEQVRRELPRAIGGNPPIRQVPRPGNQGSVPKAQGNSLPSESGRESTTGPRFGSGDFFGPPSTQPPRVVQPTPRVIQPQPRTVYPGLQNYPNYRPADNPRGTNPTQTLRYPSNPPQNYPRATITQPPAKPVSVSQLEFKLRCPRELQRSVSYQLISNGRTYPFTMNPGEAQKIVESKVWRVRYSSNGREVTYRLRGGGTYEFARDPNGQLQLFREPETDIEPPLRSSSSGQ